MVSDPELLPVQDHIGGKTAVEAVEITVRILDHGGLVEGVELQEGPTAQKVDRIPYRPFKGFGLFTQGLRKLFGNLGKGIDQGSAAHAPILRPDKKDQGNMGEMLPPPKVLPGGPGQETPPGQSP